MSLGLSRLVTSISSCGWSGAATPPRRAARSRSSAGSLNCSAGSSPSQMMYLASASSPTSLTSRMASPRRLRGGRQRTRHVRTLVQQTPETRADTLGGCALLTAGPCKIARLAALKPLDYPIDALGEGADVIGFDRGEHRDPQLVAAEFAVRLGVNDAVSPERLRDRRGVYVVHEIDRANHLGTQRGVGDERRGEGPLLGP